ncbi:hypothetical protein [Tranquillimonas alkanivorans]|uniref:Uncharacterized protein n=1 Tax=Tranquillimonas alkanivorans TaxID=441119 RepID=A0A1I5TV98_9RHOB|nr:hypothetical protein [Tranquillimonas alkanivorans]SFP86517.1 hypothetical protein SAMN04488047_11527 [Tranquillimonas alkanivorans]
MPQSERRQPRIVKRFGIVEKIDRPVETAIHVTVAGPSDFRQTLQISDPAFIEAIEEYGIGANIWTRAEREQDPFRVVYLMIDGRVIEPARAT